MVLSINTNVGAMIALQNLNRSNDAIVQTQLHVTTGLKVNGPKEDAATYAIAQNMRGDIAGYRAVRIALNGGDSTVGVAIGAGKAISDLLIEMKQKIVQANQDGLDTASRTSLQLDFASLRDQIETIVATAEFNNKNLIFESATNFSVLSTVEGSVITISAQKMDTTTIGINTSTLLNSAGAASALTAINSAIVVVSDKLATLGSSSKRIDIQADFTTLLVDPFR